MIDWIETELHDALCDVASLEKLSMSSVHPAPGDGSSETPSPIVTSQRHNFAYLIILPSLIIFPGGN